MSEIRTENSQNIFLVGFMGSGKTAVSKLLNKRYGFEIIDMDDEIEKREKRTIPHIFEEEGESYFRALETALLKELEYKKNLVVSCGGGAVLIGENVESMQKSGCVVYLTATPETVYERVKHCNNRPLLKGKNNQEFIAELMGKRREYYEGAADITIHTDQKSIMQICEELMRKLP